MWIQSVGNFFKKIGVDVAKVIGYLPELETKFSKAVVDAKADTAETIATGKPFIAAVAVASAAIVAATTEKGLNWQDDTSAVAQVEAAFKLWPAFWAAIEKEGSDLTLDLEAK
jgi:hypothetical protein